VKFRHQEYVELYSHSPLRLYGIVFNEASKDTASVPSQLPLTDVRLTSTVPRYSNSSAQPSLSVTNAVRAHVCVGACE
jgi:hypothetical protein